MSGVFRRRRVFRTTGTTPSTFGNAIVTGSLALGVITITGTATAVPIAVANGTGSGVITITGTPPATLLLQVSAPGVVAITGTATGLQRSLGNAPGQVTITGTAAVSLGAPGLIRLVGNASAATVFTAEPAGTLSITMTAAGRLVGAGTGPIVITMTATPEVFGGTVEANASGGVSLTGAAVATNAATAVLPVAITGTAEGVRLGSALADPVSPARCTIEFNPDKCQISMSTRINEGSQLVATFKFPTLPTTLRYRVDCEETGTLDLVPWTVITPDVSGTITIPASVNRIIDADNRTEEKTLLIETNYDTEAAANFTRSYTVKNVRGKGNS